jgi:hypothetical protein
MQTLYIHDIARRLVGDPRVTCHVSHDVTGQDTVLAKRVDRTSLRKALSGETTQQRTCT